MFFIGRKVGNDTYEVVDTKDWVAEVYTKVQLARIKLMGIDIVSSDIQQDIVVFMWFYNSITQEVGSSTLDFIDDYIRGTGSCNAFSGEVGGSTFDLIDDCKSEFDKIKKKWTDVTLNDLTRSGLYNDFVFSLNTRDASHFCNTRHFSKRYVEKIF